MRDYNISDNRMLLAIKAALEAGELLRAKENVRVDDAYGKDIKLSSDKASEAVIFNVLSDSDYPILSEEAGCDFDPKEQDRFWIVDPLDGTMNYYRGMDDYACVSIALWESGEPLLGVIYRFMTDELFYGMSGCGAYCNENEIHPSEVTTVKQAVLATGFPVKRSYDDKSLTEFVKSVQSFKKIRLLGTAAIMGAYVACGRVDAYMEEEIMIWDIAAAWAIVKASGGTANVTLLDQNKCVCRLFANNSLERDYRAYSIV